MLMFYQKCVVTVGIPPSVGFCFQIAKQEMDMAAALRPLIEWDDSSPVTLNSASTRADERYIQLSLPVGHERDPLRLLDPGIGLGVVQSTFNKLKALQHGGCRCSPA